MFPRTALVLRRLLPTAQLTIIDADRHHLEEARGFLKCLPVEFRHTRYAAPLSAPFDLLVVPLAFDGDREAIYACPPAPVVLIHDWIWHRRGESRIVSVLLLKRLNLVRP